MLRELEKSYGLRQGRSQRISGHIHCRICVCLAFSEGIKSYWTGAASSGSRLAQILDSRDINVWAVLRRQSWQCHPEGAVLLDTHGCGFSAGLFDCCDVRISHHNF